MQPRFSPCVSYVLLLTMAPLALAKNSRDVDQKIDFNRDIRPILSDNCFQCHGPDAAHREADLRLDHEADAKRDRGGYSVIDLVSPSASELLMRVKSSDDDTVMPPRDADKELTEQEIRLLQAWISQGAQWSRPWALVRPRKHTLPESSAATWHANWIDKFVFHQLKAEGLIPSEDADPVTLVRRLSFDLTGLPPDYATVLSYEADSSEKNLEAIVDRLLASPHFGERMAMYWLDLVRFADTVGYHGDQNHGIWPYRDYVIHSFNTNKGFDQFTIEQLAGDLLPESSTDDLIASGYNRLLQTSHEGGVQLKEYRAIYLADRVRNVSQVWMAATMGCAQCHDHKFDALSMKDFYSLGAFFADIDDEAHLRNPYLNRNTSPTVREPELPVFSVYQRQKIAAIDSLLETLDPQRDDEVAELIARRDKIASRRTPTLISRMLAPRTVRILPRGNWQDESGTIVQPQVPKSLGTIDVGGRRATRLDLARWLTQEQGAGGLTARVMVNRLWYLMFGRGIASQLDDFGGQGRPPTHPRLLDNLAVEFLESGWDVKHMLKLMAMSRAYRQSSVATLRHRQLDPENRLFSRQSRYRLPAEMIRDNCLCVSGLLEPKIGGPSIKPYQPAGLYKHLNYPKRKYKHDTDSSQWRRGVYVHWQRQFLHPMLKTFDAPNREECTAKRSQTNTPLAALTLLNDPSFVEAARILAQRVLQEAQPTEDHRIFFLFNTTLSRSPDEFEREQIAGLLNEQRNLYRANQDDLASLLTIGIAPTDTSLNQPELAAWTIAARTLLNLSETNTRN